MYKIRYFFLLFILLMSNAFAIQKAIVKKRKIIIYADKELTSPIGYLKRGTKLMVSDRPMAKETIIATIISGKITFLKLKGLTLAKDQREDTAQLNNYAHMGKKDLKNKDKIQENNYLIFGFGIQSLGNKWKIASETSNDSISKAFQFKIGVEHRPPFKKWSWGLVLSYLENKQNKIAFQSAAIEVPITWRLFRSNFLQFELTLSPIFSGDSRITVRKTRSSYQGLGYGGAIGTQIRLFPLKSFNLNFMAEYRKLIIKGLGNIQTDLNTYVGVNEISGFNLGLGLSYLL